MWTALLEREEQLGLRRNVLLGQLCNRSAQLDHQPWVGKQQFCAGRHGALLKIELPVRRERQISLRARGLEQRSKQQRLRALVYRAVIERQSEFLRLRKRLLDQLQKQID